LILETCSKNDLERSLKISGDQMVMKVQQYTTTLSHTISAIQ